MKKIAAITCFFLSLLVNSHMYAQDSLPGCKVLLVNIGTHYNGECQDGLADGQGEATGIDKYNGHFKLGRPDGYGVYNYSDTAFYAGYFRDGLKEGKGEMLYKFQGRPDSTVKGYWSGNVFRGKKYITYNFNGANLFDRYEIIATPETGHTISFDISTTSGSPTGVPSDLQGKPGYVLKLDDLNSGGGTIIRLLSVVDTPTKTHVTYDIDTFPVILYGNLSNGDNFRLELFKAAKWTVKFYINR